MCKSYNSSCSKTNLLTYSMEQTPSWEANLFTVKKFPPVYGTRRFITAFTSARHLSLSWAISIHSMLSHPISWRSILILSSHLRLGLPSGLFPSGFPIKTLYTCTLHHTWYMPRPSKKKKGKPDPPSWGFDVGLTTPSRRKRSSLEELLKPEEATVRQGLQCQNIKNCKVK